MKFIFVILILLSSLASLGQAYYNDPISGWNILTHAPSDTSVPHPVVIFIVGSGEANTDTAYGALYGPLYQFRNNVWDGEVLGEEAWVIHIQPSAPTTTASQYRLRLNTLFQRHPSFDTCRVYLTGLSMGAAVVTNQMHSYDGVNYFPYKYAAIVAMSVGDYSATGANIPVMDAVPWLNSGGRWYGLVGNSDTRPQTQNYADSFAIVAPGTSQFYEYIGGHDGWGVQYNPNTRNLNGENVYDYMGKHSKKPYANAVEDTIITTSFTVLLEGIVDSIATGHNGWDRSITWAKSSGGAATITTPNNSTTTVTGLSVGDYTFTLTSANAAGGLTASKNVLVQVLDSPLKIVGIKEKTHNWVIEKL